MLKAHHLALHFEFVELQADEFAGFLQEFLRLVTLAALGFFSLGAADEKADGETQEQGQAGNCK